MRSGSNCRSCDALRPFDPHARTSQSDAALRRVGRLPGLGSGSRSLARAPQAVRQSLCRLALSSVAMTVAPTPPIPHTNRQVSP